MSVTGYAHRVTGTRLKLFALAAGLHELSHGNRRPERPPCRYSMRMFAARTTFSFASISDLRNAANCSGFWAAA